jgi:hypothetical protein
MKFRTMLLFIALSATTFPIMAAEQIMNSQNPKDQISCAPGFQGPMTDAISRHVPMSGDVRPFQPKKKVGIFYFLWLDLDYIHDSSKIIKQHPDAVKKATSPPWGVPNQYHFWGEPLWGYYRSQDPWVLRRHACLLADAGIDFLVFDTTNAATYDKTYLTLCKVFDELRQSGTKVPKIAFMVNTRAGETARKIYEKLYKPGLYPELWFRLQGRPLMLCDPNETDEELKDFFTLRKAHWPFTLVNTQNEWHWEATYPQVYSYDKNPEQPEEINVSVGQNLHWKTGIVEMMSTGNARGRSFHAGRRAQKPDDYLHGHNFQEQWTRVFELDPEIVFITGWNEWIAMQLQKDQQQRPVFCDQFNLELSRDVEMMRGGYGDNYYCQMVSNIRRFKGMPEQDPPAIAISNQSMAFNLDSLWSLAPRSYNDHAFETIPRDYPGCGKLHYKETSGRNDFRMFKVAHDSKYVYFMVKTREQIIGQGEANWMTLMLRITPNLADDQKSSDEKGTTHEFLVNNSCLDGKRVSLQCKSKGGLWEPAGVAELRVAGDRLLLAVPRKTLGNSGAGFTIDFKWFDNVNPTGEAIDFYIKGDVAPEGRFFYRYRGESNKYPENKRSVPTKM